MRQLKSHPSPRITTTLTMKRREKYPIDLKKRREGRKRGNEKGNKRLKRGNKRWAGGRDG
jgi:hypothetical protein